MRVLAQGRPCDGAAGSVDTWHVECSVARLSPLPPHTLSEARLINIKFRRYCLLLRLTIAPRRCDPILEMGKLSQEVRQWSRVTLR